MQEVCADEQYKTLVLPSCGGCASPPGAAAQAWASNAMIYLTRGSGSGAWAWHDSVDSILPPQ
eukprot:7355374-Prorocentrum_lima.AAC.1